MNSLTKIIEAVSDSDVPNDVREPLYDVWNRYREYCEKAGDSADLADFRTGFVYGHAAAATRWRSIERHGLPEEKGRYFWKCQEGAVYPYEYRFYDPRLDSYDFLAGNYTHYRKIEFTEE